MSRLPNVEARARPTVVSRPLANLAGMQVAGPGGKPLWLEPVTPIAPAEWPPTWGEPRPGWRSLAIAWGCYWLWCFALAPRIWRGRRGAAVALRLIASRVLREFGRGPLAWLLFMGTAAIFGVWAIGGAPWAGLMTALVGLVGSGGIVWAVRLIGAAALRREAMGFGDVTLMMMIGTFLGWQACLITFFLAPFAGLAAGVAQLIFRRDDVIPYGPFLCLGAATTVACWAAIWSRSEHLFAAGPLVPAVVIVCLALLGILLYLWGMLKRSLFAGGR
jgi:hypothetical protein